MNVLVAVASRHGSTQEIAEVITDELRAAGIQVDQRHVDEVRSIEGYQAIILGSAVYLGNWLPEARLFIERRQPRLATIPVWLFSSGPLGTDDPKPHGDPAKLSELLEATHAREHHIFVGKLDPHGLSFSERLIAKAVRAPAGDFRQWDAVRAWARGIARTLASPVPEGV
jgi:menaquinone-dependent protoporphyrinogen oxidase